MSKKQVIFFVGQDITAHLIMNRVVKDVLEKGVYEPVLFFPKNAYSPRADIPQLREFSFYDKALLNNTVYPFINAKPYDLEGRAVNLTPQQFNEDFGVHVETIDDVNDPALVARIAQNDNIACALSLRCTQIFRKDITEAIKRRAPFMNLHSGLLPDYRGVMPTLRRMFDIASGAVAETDYGCTLHKVDYFDPNAVDHGIDTGKIIEVKSIALNSNHSGYLAQVALAEAGAESLIKALSEVEHNYTLRGYPQNNENSAYYTFPTQKELIQWKQAGVTLVRPEEVVHTLVDAFSAANTSHGDELTAVINEAIREWYVSTCECRSNGFVHLLDGSCPNYGTYYPAGASSFLAPPRRAVA